MQGLEGGPVIVTGGASGIGNAKDMDEGAAFLDYDLDGDMDLFVVYVEAALGARIWESRGDGTFFAAEASVIDAPFLGVGLGLSAEDWDADGDIDFSTRHVFRRNRLLEAGTRKFTLGLTPIPNSYTTSATPAWGDWDRDGDLDLALGNYLFHGSFWTNTSWDADAGASERRDVRVLALDDGPPGGIAPAAHRREREVDEELAGARVLQERAVDGEQDDQRRGNGDRRAVDALERHVHVADEPRQLVALVGPRRRQEGAEEGVEQEAERDHRHDPAGGAAHRLEDQHRQRDAENDVPAVGQDRAVEEVVPAGDEVHGAGHAGEREQPVPPHDAVAVAPRDRENEEREEQHERDVDRPQVLRAHDGVGGVKVKERHRHRNGGDEDGEHARELVVDTLLALDHLLGAMQRFFADLLRRLVQPRDLFAHRSSRKKKGPASALDGALAGCRLS